MIYTRKSPALLISGSLLFLMMLDFIRKYFLIFLFGLAAFFTQSCAHVKPYQRMYLNDDEMDTKAKLAEFNELNAESYREGASGANGGKAGGGCGCN